MLLSFALAACSGVTVSGETGGFVDPDDSGGAPDPCLTRTGVRADVYVDAGGSLPDAIIAAPRGRIFLTAGEYGDVVLGEENDGLELIGACREGVRVGSATREGGGALSLSHLSVGSVEAGTGQLTTNDVEIAALSSGGEVQMDDGVLNGWTMSGGVGLLSRSVLSGVVYVPSGVQLAMVEDVCTDAHIDSAGTVLMRNGSFRGGEFTTAGVLGVDSWSLGTSTLTINGGQAELSHLMLSSSTMNVNGGGVSAKGTVGVASGLAVADGTYAESSASWGGDSTLIVAGGVVSESALTADLASVSVIGGKLTLSAGEFSRAARAITIDDGLLVMNGTEIGAEEWAIVQNGGIVTINDVTATAPIFVGAGTLTARDLVATTVRVDGGDARLTDGEIGSRNGGGDGDEIAVALDVSGGLVTARDVTNGGAARGVLATGGSVALVGGSVRAREDAALIAVGGEIVASGVTLRGGGVSVGVGAGGTVRCTACHIAGSQTSTGDMAEVDDVEVGGVMGDGSGESGMASAVGVVVDGGTLSLTGGTISGHDALALWMGSGSATLAGVTIRGGVYGGVRADGGVLGVGGGVTSGPRGIVVRAGATARVSGTVFNSEIGVLLDGVSAGVDGSRWGGNGTDVWQQNCDGVPAPTGVGGASTSLCVATVVVPEVGWIVEGEGGEMP